MAILISNATAVGSTAANGMPYRAIGKNRTYQAVLSGTGTLSATIVVEATNDTDTGGNPRNWVPPIGTITLSDTMPSDGFPSTANWMFVRMRLTAISGTNASVYGGVEVS